MFCSQSPERKDPQLAKRARSFLHGQGSFISEWRGFLSYPRSSAASGPGSDASASADRSFHGPGALYHEWACQTSARRRPLIDLPEMRTQADRDDE
jgi:hypothetical protein